MVDINSVFVGVFQTFTTEHHDFSFTFLFINNKFLTFKPFRNTCKFLVKHLLYSFQVLVGEKYDSINKSSAYLIILHCDKTDLRSLKCNKNSKGPRMNPWGTAHSNGS